jgi:hypothetical protein
VRVQPCGWILLFTLVPSAAWGQVNAEVLRPNLFRAGLSGGLDGSLALARGNIELLDLGGAGRIQYQTLHPATSSAALPFVAQRVFLAANGRFAERSGTPFISQGFVHARWTGMWHPRLGSDLFAQYQFNEFLRLTGRAILGAGLRAELVHDATFMVWGGTGYLFEYDRISVLPGASDPPETYEHRLTNYLTARLVVVADQIWIQSTTYLQPRLDQPKDYRALTELELLIKLSEALALGTTLSLLYDSAPPTGVLGSDLRLYSVFRASF